MKFQGSTYPLTSALLEANRVNPATVSLDGISLAGYFTFNLDISGKRIFDGHAVKKTWHEWSRPELGEQVIETMRKDCA